MQSHQAQPIVYVVVGVLVLGLIIFRMRRMMRPSPFNPYRAWLLPVLFLALSALALFGAKPVGMDWAWVLGAFLLGAVIGYFRGKSISMSIAPDSHTIMAQGSAMAMVFIVILIGARYGLHYLLDADATALKLRPVMADVLSAVMGAGIFVARGAEMGWRGHKMLETARSAPAITTTERA